VAKDPEELPEVALVGELAEARTGERLRLGEPATLEVFEGAMENVSGPAHRGALLGEKAVKAVK
jgi:hypothetical protein